MTGARSADDEEELTELCETEGTILDNTFDRAAFGPYCEEGCATRTQNPSKICTRCLGERACSWCKGSGLRSSGGACLYCPGTGLRKEE